jgi:outer membrane lipoprotein-sorting protein
VSTTRTIKWAAILALFLGCQLHKVCGDSTVDLSPLKACFEAQHDLKSISADFTQTRALKTLKSPISVKGHFWFASPDRFRWQLGDPPKTIIIGAKDGTIVIHPSLKHAEIGALSTSGSFPTQKVFEMMGLSGKRTLEEFQKRMHVLSLKTSGTRCHLEMLPKDPSAARGLSSINFDFDCVTGQWLDFEIVTREGSSIRTEFNNVRTNSVINGEVFDYDLRGFTVNHEKK